jgi:hypothetical protein
MGIAFEWIAPSVTAAHTEGTATNHTDMREPPGWGDDVSPPAEEAEPETEPTPAPASEMSVEEEECLIPPSQPENDADDEDTSAHEGSCSHKRAHTPTSPLRLGRSFSGIPDIHAPDFWLLPPNIRELAYNMERSYESASTAVNEVRRRCMYRTPRTIREYCDMNISVLQGAALVFQGLPPHHREYCYYRLSLDAIGVAPHEDLDAPLPTNVPVNTFSILNHPTEPPACRPRTPLDLRRMATERIVCTPIHRESVRAEQDAQAPVQPFRDNNHRPPLIRQSTTSTASTTSTTTTSSTDAHAPASPYAPFRAGNRRATIRRSINFIQQEHASRNIMRRQQQQGHQHGPSG